MEEEATNSLDSMTVELIKAQEGYSATSYKDAQGRSIGYGHFIKAGEEYLRDTTLSKEEAEGLLAEDIKKHQEPWIGKLEKKMSSPQLAALTSFAYNAGPGAAKALIPFLNSGDYESAYNVMRKYRKARVGPNGELEIVDALVKRREFEIELFQSGARGGGDTGPGQSYIAAGKWQAKKGLLKGLREKFFGPQRFAAASIDPGEIGNMNKETLSGLQALCARLNAQPPVDIDEMTWTARVIEEGRGW